MILIAEDQHEIRTIISELLKTWGYSTIAFENGAQAAQYLATGGMEKISMLITDFKMPEMNGVELIEHARALCPTLPVLIISGHTTMNISENIPYLQKPFRANNLKLAIENCYRDKEKPRLDENLIPILTQSA